MHKPVKVGVVGVGAISNQYLGMAKNFPIVEMAAVADLDPARAKAQAEKYGIPKVYTVDEIFKDKSIEIILNLTVPKAHVPIGLKAIKAGKHMYAEKPLGTDRADGKKLLAAAKKAGLRVGCAPDTFMGSGIQTARKLLDDGAIGKPVAFTAFMMCPGHESWHPSPEFYYEVGGGPMFDMGPYYLTALLNLLGPVKRVMGSATIAIPERTITSQPKKGKKMKVETPDHIAGTIEFENGAMGAIVTTFATQFSEHNGKQPIMIFGTEGTMRVPDPNGFDGPVHYRKTGDDEWTWQKPTFVKGYGRSVGLADMAQAIRSNRPHRASAEQAYAVLDLMQAFLDSSDQGKAIKPTTKYERPAAMNGKLPYGKLDG